MGFYRSLNAGYLDEGGPRVYVPSMLYQDPFTSGDTGPSNNPNQINAQWSGQRNNDPYSHVFPWIASNQMFFQWGGGTAAQGAVLMYPVNYQAAAAGVPHYTQIKISGQANSADLHSYFGIVVMYRASNTAVAQLPTASFYYLECELVTTNPWKTGLQRITNGAGVSLVANANQGLVLNDTIRLEVYPDAANGHRLIGYRNYPTTQLFDYTDSSAGKLSMTGGSGIYVAYLRTWTEGGNLCCDRVWFDNFETGLLV